jgi:nucleoid-associated protein YgaU
MGLDMARLAVVLGTVVAFLLGEVAFAGTEPPPVRVPVLARPEPPVAGDSSVVVARGDHLWKISERRIEETFQTNPPDVAPYWRQVIEVNRDGLRSGDPDLIYPGEVITLPEPG